MPSVKRLVFLSVPEGTTRLAMLKRGEADVAYLLEGQLGESIRIRLMPQPSPYNRSIAATSSGVCITSLRGKLPRE